LIPSLGGTFQQKIKVKFEKCFLGHQKAVKVTCSDFETLKKVVYHYQDLLWPEWRTDASYAGNWARQNIQTALRAAEKSSVGIYLSTDCLKTKEAFDTVYKAYC
jgi:hypothetical protein